MIFSPRSPIEAEFTVHLAIDVHDSHLLYLDLRQAEYLRIGIRQFADDLALLGVPTIWIVARRKSLKFRYYSDTLTRPRFHIRNGEKQIGSKKEFINLQRSLEEEINPLSGVLARKDEDIFSKGANNAFEHPLLNKILKQNNIHNVIITGLHTHCCVLATVRGAWKNKFRTIVVPHYLGDGKMLKGIVTPREQKELLAQDLWGIEKDVEFADPESLLCSVIPQEHKQPVRSLGSRDQMAAVSSGPFRRFLSRFAIR